jgi:hypothetical protein
VSRILRYRAVEAKHKSGGVKCGLELKGPDQLCEDMVEVVSVGQLTLSTKTNQHCILNLTDQKFNHVEH